MSKRITILGAGESGVGAALLAKREAYDTFVSDFGAIAPDKEQELRSADVDFESGTHSHDRVLRSDEIIKSPGIPDTAPIVVQAREKGIPVISEIEFAARFTSARKVAITGTNGKTTTATLTHHVLGQCGMKSSLAGNVGRSFARAVAEDPEPEVYVLEVSSFQLDGMFDFKADVSILLNITPDHLDRYHDDFEQYIASKFRVFRNQGSAEHFITNADDPVIQSRLQAESLGMQYWPVSTSKSLAGLGHRGAGIHENLIQINTQNEPFTMKIQELALQGKHNLFNSMAAGVTARLFELRKELVRDSLTNFENIEHRLEFVTKVHGISFINDSKATNINSTWYALESMSEPVIWIAGGVDKGNDYTELYELVGAKVKALICLGTDNSKLQEAFAGRIETIAEASSADEAVQLAYDLGYKGDTVLLSPACASFDLFQNYEDRGQQFKAAVRRL